MNVAIVELADAYEAVAMVMNTDRAEIESPYNVLPVIPNGTLLGMGIELVLAAVCKRYSMPSRDVTVKRVIFKGDTFKVEGGCNVGFRNWSFEYQRVREDRKDG